MNRNKYKYVPILLIILQIDDQECNQMLLYLLFLHGVHDIYAQIFFDALVRISSCKYPNNP